MKDKIEISFKDIIDYLREKDMEIYNYRVKCNNILKYKNKYQKVLDEIKITSDSFKDNKIEDYIIFKRRIEEILGDIYD